MWPRKQRLEAAEKLLLERPSPKALEDKAGLDRSEGAKGRGKSLSDNTHANFLHFCNFPNGKKPDVCGRFGCRLATLQVSPHEEPLNLQALRRAAEDGDLESMARSLERKTKSDVQTVRWVVFGSLHHFLFLVFRTLFVIISENIEICWTFDFW